MGSEGETQHKPGVDFKLNTSEFTSRDDACICMSLPREGALGKMMALVGDAQIGEEKPSSRSHF